MITERFQQLTNWLAQLPNFQQGGYTTPEPASNDASFRRYYRVWHQALNQSFIIMDAPPEHEDCRPFVNLAAKLHAMQLKVPEVLAQDLQQGFLLLTDLGSTQYLSVLNNQTVEPLYQDALGALAQLHRQGKKDAETLPVYSESILQTEMNLFTDWLMEKHLNLSFNALQKDDWLKTQAALVASAQHQPQVFVHRDYHSRNLMVQPAPAQSPGILDFQDALKGPITYDAVSLIRDCYITWPADQVVEWQRMAFLQSVADGWLAKQDWASYQRAMDLMGIQRHLKASGIFARLYHRDDKAGYLADIPPTLNYLVAVGKQYPEMHFLVNWVENKMLANWPTQPAEKLA